MRDGSISILVNFPGLSPSMISTPPAFLRYVEAARQGRIELWRIVVGALLIVTVYVAPFVGLAVAARLDSSSADWLFESRIGTACLLASSLAMWCGVWIAVRLLHRRPLRSVLGADGHISWQEFARGLAAALVAAAFTELAVRFVDPSTQRSSIALGEWAMWLAPIAVLIAVQASAEELLFRGYLLQSFAARFRSPLVWAVVPLAVFTLLHWNSEASEWMNTMALFSVGFFGLTATILVYVTGNLGASMGLHLGCNLFGMLLFSHQGWFSQMALFQGRPLEGPGWTASDAFLLGLISVAGSALSLWLLLDRRSPLAVNREHSRED